MPDPIEPDNPSEDESPPETAVPRPADVGQPDAGTVEGVRKQKRQIRRKDRESADIWAPMLGTEIGRRELYGILEKCGTFEQRFATGPNGFPQSEATWMHAGEQRVGVWLYLMWLKLDPANTNLMLLENHPELRSKKPSPSK